MAQKRTKPTGRRKPDERRQRANTAPDLAVIDGGGRQLPEPPRRWLKATVEAYEAYRASATAAYLELDAEEAVVLRYFDVMDEAERLEREGRKSTLVEGSTGQPTLNPLLKHAQALRDEMRKDEAVLGIGPKRRLELGIKVGEAAAGLDEMNRRLSARLDEDADDDGEDPRVVEVRSRAR